ncbi:MAG: SDR family oxidoreductase [Myxococcota bacterium]
MTRSVLITGASTGIGRVCAIDLDRRGFRVFAGVRRTEDGEALREQASERVRPLVLDVVDESQVRQAAAAIDEELGDAGLDGLVNNAGIVVAGPLEFVPTPDLRRQLDVNVIGQLSVTRAMLPLVRRATGRIVFIGSSNGYLSTPFTGPYCASKYAIEAIADALRRELRPWKIEISLVQPGAIRTPIWEKSKSAADAFIEGLPPEALDLYGAVISSVTDLVDQRAASAAPARIVADAVRHALTARRPKTRYKVGLDARVQSLLSRLPDRLVDRLLGRVFGNG